MALALIALVGCGGSSSHSKAGGIPPVPTSTTVKLDSQAAELISAIKGTTSLTYHASYAAVVSGTTVTIDVWQKPPNTRRDTQFTAGTSPPTHTEEFKLGSSLVGCIQQGTGSQWTCKEEPAGATDPSQGVTGSITQLLANRSVSVSNATINGRAAKCYTSPPVGTLQTVKVCIAADTHIPVSVDSGEGTGAITLTALDNNVPDSSFSLPATATSVTTTTGPSS
jgi:hypothetical protein